MRAVWIIPSISQNAKYSFKIFVVNWYKFVGFASNVPNQKARPPCWRGRRALCTLTVALNKRTEYSAEASALKQQECIEHHRLNIEYLREIFLSLQLFAQHLEENFAFIVCWDSKDLSMKSAESSTNARKRIILQLMEINVININFNGLQQKMW